MSRIGRLPVAIPAGVTVKIEQTEVSVKGPKGELTRTFHPDIKIEMKDNQFTVSRPDDEKFHRALHGLTRTLLSNMVTGVTNGFDRRLEIVGVGYRAEKKGTNLAVSVGFSNVVQVQPKAGVTLDTESPTMIRVSGP